MAFAFYIIFKYPAPNQRAMADQTISDALHPLERAVLPACKGVNEFKAIVKLSGKKEVEVMRALQWLANRKLVELSHSMHKALILGDNGMLYLEKGLPERRFMDALDNEMRVTDAAKKAGIKDDEISITLGVLRRKAAITLRKDKDLYVSLTDHGKAMRKKRFLEEDFLKLSFPLDPDKLDDTMRFAFSELKGRKDIVRIEVRKETKVLLAPEAKALIAKGLSQGSQIERLTPQIIKDGSWKSKRFRPYDVEINVPKIHGGKRHFVNQAVDDIKRIWLDLGFKEMRGTIVQTSFWDLDALFVPQDHPARDMQDTFYIKDPKHGKLPKALMAKVKATHENGWKTGSAGWRYTWSEEIAKENLLRTHTTVLSAQTISRLKESDLPAKFFSVKKVYRNETLSWKSLFEFVQVEGIVVDPGANFMHLKGYLLDFFRKMGFTNIRVRPGHFPYTEPSAEVDVWHPGKKAWVELGGSGIFRPEVVQPLLGKPVPVLAWGLGMERTIMEYYKITDIRDLYRNDIKQLREIKVWKGVG
jgi:phenylalanyl-tRNA synthetase alpha chain